MLLASRADIARETVRERFAHLGSNEKRGRPRKRQSRELHVAGQIDVGKSVATRPALEPILGDSTYENRRGRESNPRIAVLQTATLPLGYPAGISASRQYRCSGACIKRRA
jgi:hypothetical protein